MPGITLPNISIILPTLGGDTGIWDEEINAALSLIDAHDHSSGKGIRIRTAALDINADLSIAGYALTNVGKAAFTPIAALAAGANVLSVNVSDGELYWRSSGGVNVKLTSGSTLNTTLVGGIVGDYTAVSAEVAYDDANARYTFKSPGTPKVWAKLASGEHRIYESGTSVSLYVGIKSPSALAASYSVEMPAALPSALSVVQVNASGVMTFSDKYRHGTKHLRIPMLHGSAHVAGSALTVTGTDPLVTQPASTTAYYPLVGIPADFTIGTFTVVCDSAPSSGVSFAVFKGTTSFSSIGAGPISGNGVLGEIPIPATVDEGSGDHPFWLQVITAGGATVSMGYVDLAYSVA